MSWSQCCSLSSILETRLLRAGWSVYAEVERWVREKHFSSPRYVFDIISCLFHLDSWRVITGLITGSHYVLFFCLFFPVLEIPNYFNLILVVLAELNIKDGMMLPFYSCPVWFVAKTTPALLISKMSYCGVTSSITLTYSWFSTQHYI